MTSLPGFELYWVMQDLRPLKPHRHHRPENTEKSIETPRGPQLGRATSLEEGWRDCGAARHVSRRPANPGSSEYP
jgi:hypothetical protein